jgi:cellobiose-specific phosphotransferase system component IIC
MVETDMRKRQNYEYYKKLQESRGEHSYVYSEKEYPRGFTMPDKKIVDNRYSSSLPRFTQKHFLLLLSIIIVVLIFSDITKKDNSYLTGTVFGIILILLSIPFFYLMNKSYYLSLIYIIAVSILGSMGYGWGLMGALINLNPFTKAEKNPKSNNIKNPKSNNIKNPKSNIKI